MKLVWLLTNGERDKPQVVSDTYFNPKWHELIGEAKNYNTGIAIEVIKGHVWNVLMKEKK